MQDLAWIAEQLPLALIDSGIDSVKVGAEGGPSLYDVASEGIAIGSFIHSADVTCVCTLGRRLANLHYFYDESRADLISVRDASDDSDPVLQRSYDGWPIYSPDEMGYGLLMTILRKGCQQAVVIDNGIAQFRTAAVQRQPNNTLIPFPDADVNVIVGFSHLVDKNRAGLERAIQKVRSTEHSPEGMQR